MAPARRFRHSGFTLIELLLVVALMAMVSGLATFALRDPATSQLENEAGRLVALLESARAQSRGSGIPVRWVPRPVQAGAEGFQFVGLPPGSELPQHWLNAGVSAQVVGVQALQLGPEPIIGPQRIVLSLRDRRLVLVTDGLGPFEVGDGDSQGTP